jgi:hypothetical protein
MKKKYLISKINDQRNDTKGVATIIMVVAVVAILAVAGIAAFFLMRGSGGGGGSSTINNMAVGDFLKFETVTTMGSTNLNYIDWMNVTALNGTGYDVLMTKYLNGHPYMENTRHVEPNKMFNSIVVMTAGRIDMGQTTINTEFGSRTVNHYQEVRNGETMDVYLGIDNGMLYKYTYSIGSESSVMLLVGSNLSWV